MTDYFLRFASESEAITALEGYDGAIDIIGEKPGDTGWHVNVRGEEAPNLKKYVVLVATPYRVWA